MENIALTGTLIGLFVAFLCSASTVHSETQNGGKRGDVPQCQKECLKEHSEKMTMLHKRLSKTGERFTYQDQVEQEEHRYALCLTNCRAIIPVK